jgi:hypothetical protein
MYKYINIKAVLNYLPDGILEEWDESQVVKTALQGFQANVSNFNITSDIKVAVCKLTNHKASVPLGLKKVIDAGFSTTLPNELPDSNTVFLQPTWNGENVIVFQALLFQMIRPSMQSMRYAGQNSDMVNPDCIPILCQDCINWSISKDLTSITCDVKDGYIFLLYTSTVQDEDGNFLIPNDNILMQALAYYVEAKHWQSRAFRKEEQANDMFIQRMQMANSSFQEFYSKWMLQNFDMEEYVWQTQTLNRLPQLAFQAWRNK